MKSEEEVGAAPPITRPLLVLLVLGAMLGTTVEARSTGPPPARRWASHHGLPPNSAAGLAQTRGGYVSALASEMAGDREGRFCVSAGDLGGVRYHQERANTRDDPAPEDLRPFVRIEGDDTRAPVVSGREVSRTFHVRAIRYSGVKTRQEVPFSLRIPPPIPRSWELLVLLGLVFFLVGYATYRWRIRVLRWRQRALEDLVAQRTGELARQNEALAAANDFKRRMIGVASHDLRGPLSGIVGLANVIAERTADPEIRETAQLIESSGTRVLTIVTDLLQAAVLEAQMPILNRQPHNLAELACAVVRHEQARARSKMQTLTLEVDEGCYASVDERWMHQAIANLVGNAVNFTPEGGTITVEVRRTTHHVRLSVRDTGPGIQPDEHERLFMPFYRGSARPTGGEASTGLGLSIVHDVVERHGGRVFCTSTPGEGATFTVELDACAAPPAPREGAPALPT